MKNGIILSFVYVVLFIISIISEYWLLVFSIFFFLGKHEWKEYENEYFIAASVVVGLLTLFFLIS
jgi:hypothetical protein